MNLTWDLTQIPEDGAVDGDDTLTAELTATKENYALTEDAAPLKVTVKPGNEEKNAKGMAMPSGTPPYSDHIINSVSPNGTVINLFDYWVTSQTASDNTDPDWRINKGINNNHALLFCVDNKSTQGIRCV